MAELYKQTPNSDFPKTHQEDNFRTIAEYIEWDIDHGNLKPSEYPYGDLFDLVYEKSPKELKYLLHIKIQQAKNKQKC